jgi:hypothetical protein
VRSLTIFCSGRVRLTHLISVEEALVIVDVILALERLSAVMEKYAGLFKVSFRLVQSFPVCQAIYVSSQKFGIAFFIWLKNAIAMMPLLELRSESKIRKQSLP